MIAVRLIRQVFWNGFKTWLPCLCLFQPWMKDFLYFLKSKGAQKSKALAKKIFLVSTIVTAHAGRKKRAGEESAFVASCYEYSGHNTALTLASPVPLSPQ